MGEIIRRRSRSSKSLITTKADSESEVVKTENSPLSTRSNLSRETEETVKWTSRREIKKQEETYITAKGIDEISSELMEDRRSGVLEFNYWDARATTGVLTSLVVSDDYWHFLGRYE